MRIAAPPHKNVIPSLEIDKKSLYKPETHKPVAPFRVLLVKPYQELSGLMHSPPLGLLSIAATLREYFGSAVEVNVMDMELKFHETWQKQSNPTTAISSWLWVGLMPYIAVKKS